MDILLRRRIMMLGGATPPPPYDAQVEYLENTGGSFINTGYIPNSTRIKIQGKFYLSDYTRQYDGWFGAYTNEDTDAYRIIQGAQDTRLYFGCASKASRSGGAYINGLNTLYVFELTYNRLTVNGVDNNYAPDPGNANANYLYLFSNGSATTTTRGKFYYFKVYEGDTLVVDLIPVRVGTTGYMYDRVHRQLYGNVGTGSFSYGSDIE